MRVGALANGPLSSRAVYVLFADVPPSGVQAFDAYEASVLPLLERHGGRIERRLRHRDGHGGWIEVHVLSFEDETGLASYRVDPERARYGELLQRSGATTRLLPVKEVDDTIDERESTRPT
jgi:hypothetical protein